MPTIDEVAALIVGSDYGWEEERDIIVRQNRWQFTANIWNSSVIYASSVPLAISIWNRWLVT